MKPLKLMAGAMLAFAATAAMAEENASGLVARIFPSSDGSVYFKLKDDSCNTNDTYYQIAPHAQQKYWFALLSMAAETGRTVKVRVVSCATEGKQVVHVYRDY